MSSGFHDIWVVTQSAQVLGLAAWNAPGVVSPTQLKTQKVWAWGGRVVKLVDGATGSVPITRSDNHSRNTTLIEIRLVQFDGHGPARRSVPKS